MSFELVQGEDRVLEINLDTIENEPFPLGDPNEITVRLEQEDGILEKTLTAGEVEIISDDRGEFKVTLDELDTASLKKGKDQSFEIVLENGLETRILFAEKMLTVFQRLSV